VGIVGGVFAVAVAYVSRFLEDFVVPVMYKHDLSCLPSWGRVLGLVKRRLWTFVLYGLFYLVLSMAAGACIVLFVLVTCCIGGCLMVIPYLGAVILLPVSVFFRLYSLEYLAQFGEDYRVLEV
jgi:hypothetical protein